jgi:isoleucyl-tRNA synthetase
MLGSLAHFHDADRVKADAMPELERLMLHKLVEIDGIVRGAYADFDYKTVVATLAAFMNSELSAFYFDVRKDTLYCDPPSSVARKAALTVIDYLFRCIVTWLAPILSFTAEEAWLSRYGSEAKSVHLELFQSVLPAWRNDALARKWDIIRAVRSVVTGALEIERAAKRIGSSLEASPVIYIPKEFAANLIDVDFAEVAITSSAELHILRDGEEPPANAFRLDDVPGVGVVVEKAVGTKCARSWKILPTVGEDPDYPDVSPRDAQALREWKALGRV